MAAQHKRPGREARKARIERAETRERSRERARLIVAPYPPKRLGNDGISRGRLVAAGDWW